MRYLLFAILALLTPTLARAQTYGQAIWGVQQGTTTPLVTIFDGTQNVPFMQLNTVTHTATIIPGTSLTIGTPITGTCGLNYFIYNSGGNVACTPSSTTVTFPQAASGTTNSGGIPYFSTTSVLSSSATLTAGQPVFGGGSGTAPYTPPTGNNTQVLVGGGVATWGQVNLPTMVTGNLPVSNLASGSNASNTTFWRGDGTWSSPSATGVQISFPLSVIGGTSGGIVCFTSSSQASSSAALTANALVYGGGAGACPATLSGLGTTSQVLIGNASGVPSWGSVALASMVSGNLPVGNLNGGSGASSSTYWRGDGTWATPSGAGTVTTTGSPSSGQLAQFSGSTSITGVADETVPVNAQTGTSYTVTSGVVGELTTLSNTGSVTVTLPQAGGTGFGAGARFYFLNRNTGAVTITPTTSTINGAASIVLQKGDGMMAVSDGTNYQAEVYPGSMFNATANQILLGGGVNNPPKTQGGLGTTSQVLIGNASGAPSWGGVNLATMASGVLAVANGGNGTASPSLTAGVGISITGSWPSQTVAVSTGPVLINTLTASNSSSLSDTTSLTNTYFNYELVFTNLIPSTNEVVCEIQVNSETSGYVAQGVVSASNGSSFAVTSTTTYIPCWLGNASSNEPANSEPGISGKIWITNPSASNKIQFNGQMTANLGSGAMGLDMVGGYYNTAGAVTSISISPSSGNWTSGTVEIYGYN